jgi:hypothetical protein
MDKIVAAGTWVEIYSVVLEPGQRAARIPHDTQQIPLEMRVKGFLAVPGKQGDSVEIITPSGRLLRGTLASVNPAYSHGFGAPIPELAHIGGEVRALLRERGHIR